MSQPRQRSGPTHIWHPAFRRHVLDEDVAFLWLTFLHHYEQEQAVAEVAQYFAEQGVKTYSIWGILGTEDLLAKVHLPKGAKYASVRDQLGDQMDKQHSGSVKGFAVERTLFHWSHRNPPTLDGDGWSAVEEDHVTALNTRRRLPDTVRRNYEEEKLLIKLTTARGIKFFMAIEHPKEDVARLADEQLTRIVESLCDSRPFLDLALYQGESPRYRYLITGRVQPSEWHAIARELTPRIRDLRIIPKTATHLSSDADPLMREEHLHWRRDDPRGDPDLISLLAEEEGLHLEFKASAFTPLRLAGRPTDGRAPDVFEILAKGIVGMLNADGGYLVVGVAELAEYGSAALLSAYPDAHIEGNYAVIGIGQDYSRSRRLIGKEWDDYHRRLLQQLRAKITPNPAPWLHITKAEVDGLPCCVIDVRMPESDTDFTLGPDFYVREGNQTRRLSARDLVDYKKQRKIRN